MSEGWLGLFEQPVGSESEHHIEDCAINAVHLCRIDLTCNIRRFYRLDVHPDLFGSSCQCSGACIFAIFRCDGKLHSKSRPFGWAFVNRTGRFRSSAFIPDARPARLREGRACAPFILARITNIAVGWSDVRCSKITQRSKV
jgi:hypothetical protein